MSLRFRGIILRVLRLESVSNHFYLGAGRVEVTVNAKEETSYDILLICIQEFGLWIVRRNLSFLDKLVHIIVVTLTYVIQRVGNTLY
jgi:hypothetical protein